MSDRAFIDQLYALATDPRPDVLHPQLAGLFGALQAQPSQVRAEGRARLAAAVDDPAFSADVQTYAAERLAALDAAATDQRPSTL